MSWFGRYAYFEMPLRCSSENVKYQVSYVDWNSDKRLSPGTTDL